MDTSGDGLRKINGVRLPPSTEWIQINYLHEWCRFRCIFTSSPSHKGLADDLLKSQIERQEQNKKSDSGGGGEQVWSLSKIFILLPNNWGFDRPILTTIVSLFLRRPRRDISGCAGQLKEPFEVPRLGWSRWNEWERTVFNPILGHGHWFAFGKNN